MHTITIEGVFINDKSLVWNFNFQKSQMMRFHPNTIKTIIRNLRYLPKIFNK